MVDEVINRYDLERAEKLAEWRGKINNELEHTNTQLTCLRDDVSNNAEEARKGDAALEKKIDSIIDMMHAVDMRSAKIGGTTGLVVSLVLLILGKVFHVV